MQDEFYNNMYRRRDFSLFGLNISTSEKEIKDLIIAWLFISLAFAIVRRTSNVIFSFETLESILISAVTVGLGFLLHELAHKVVAQRYHCWAEFRAEMQMLVLAVIMSFFGFVFAAPGAVWISGKVNKTQNGIISFAGPFTNIIIAILFIPLAIFGAGLIHQIGVSGFLINSWLALFNMIPFGMLDGRKILSWNKLAYFSILIISGVFVFFSFGFIK